MKKTNEKQETTVAQIVMPREQYAALQAQAEAYGVSLSAYLKMLISDALAFRKSAGIQ